MNKTVYILVLSSYSFIVYCEDSESNQNSLKRGVVNSWEEKIQDYF